MKPNGGVKQSSSETYNNGPKNRRIRAKERLEQQLKSGMKPGKRPVRGIDTPLEPADIKRIEKELSTLKNRI